LVGQRVFGIALGYEDVNDRDYLHHDPIMAVLASKLEAQLALRPLNRLDRSLPSVRCRPTRYSSLRVLS
jgi:hypothetical protein